MPVQTTHMGPITRLLTQDKKWPTVIIGHCCTGHRGAILQFAVSSGIRAAYIHLYHDLAG